YLTRDLQHDSHSSMPLPFFCLFWTSFTTGFGLLNNIVFHEAGAHFLLSDAREFFGLNRYGWSCPSLELASPFCRQNAVTKFAVDIADLICQFKLLQRF